MKSFRIFFCLVCFGFVIAPVTFADQLRLVNGDRLHGEILSQDASQITFKSDILGTVKVAKENVLRIIAPAIEEAITKKIDGGEAKAADWKRKITVGYMLQDGNTEAEELMLEGEIKRTTPTTELLIQGKSFYSETDGEAESNTQYGLVKYTHDLWKSEEVKLNREGIDHLKPVKVDGVYKVEVDTDQFSDIKYRIVPTIGIAYWTHNRDDFKFHADIGAGITHTKFLNSGEETEATIVPSIYFEKKVFEKSTLSEEFKVYPTIGDIGTNRFVSETKLSTPLGKNVDLNVSLIDTYDTAEKDTKENDLKLTSSLSYVF